MIRSIAGRAGALPGVRPAGIIEPMSLDPTWLFLSLFPSGAGFVLFVYGRKQQRWALAGFGVAFMAYPYLAQSIGALLGVGVALSLALWLAIRGGWA
jgi:hypothetical protein